MTWFPSAMRALTKQVLLAAQTDAGQNVETSRVAPVPSRATPFVGIYTPTEAKRSIAPAGTAPQFRATLHLHVACRVEAASKDLVEAQLDSLVGQIHDALLTSPAWTSFNGSDATVEACNVAARIEYEAELHVGLATVAFELTYTDTYPANVPDGLGTMALAPVPASTFDPGNTNAAIPAPLAPGGFVAITLAPAE